MALIVVLLFRALTGALVLGVIAWAALRKRPERTRVAATVGALLAGVALSWGWREVALTWAGNVLSWLQDGSTLTLVGGLRGLGTRLTLSLALLGAALATAAGRHVTIDLVARAMPERARKPLAVLGGLLAAVVCGSSAFGSSAESELAWSRNSPMPSRGGAVSLKLVRPGVPSRYNSFDVDGLP
jgi:hypothetical protein